VATVLLYDTHELTRDRNSMYDAKIFVFELLANFKDVYSLWPPEEYYRRQKL